jgi:hypothetical protein
MRWSSILLTVWYIVTCWLLLFSKAKGHFWSAGLNETNIVEPPIFTSAQTSRRAFESPVLTRRRYTVPISSMFIGGDLVKRVREKNNRILQYLCTIEHSGRKMLWSRVFLDPCECSAEGVVHLVRGPSFLVEARGGAHGSGWFPRGCS